MDAAFGLGDAFDLEAGLEAGALVLTALLFALTGVLYVLSGARLAVVGLVPFLLVHIAIASGVSELASESVPLSLVAYKSNSH